jgi:ankyrin repeat protein
MKIPKSKQRVMDFSKYRAAIESREKQSGKRTDRDDKQNAKLTLTLRDLVKTVCSASTKVEDQTTAIELMKRLLDLGADPNSLSSKNGWYVIMFVAKWQECPDTLLNIRAMQLLLDYRADLHVISVTDGASALHVAARYGRTQMVEFLLTRGCRPCSPENHGLTALDLALLCNDHTGLTDMIKSLVKRGVSAQQATLFRITLHGHTSDYMRILLENGLVDVNCVDANGDTLLHAAACNRIGGHALILLLLAYDANPTLINKKGSLPFWLACGGGSVECAEALALYVDDDIMAKSRVPHLHPDYIGMSRLYFKYGSKEIMAAEIVNKLPTYSDDTIWAMVRLALPTLDLAQRAAIRGAVRKTGNFRLVRLVDGELAGDFRTGVNNDTDLHIAVRNKSLVDIQYAMEQRVNPFLLNSKGKKGECALDYPCTPEIRTMLDEYVRFNCLPHQMRWWGPYFRKRVVAFLLVVQRWHKEKVREIPRDIRVCILRWVARFEAV